MSVDLNLSLTVMILLGVCLLSTLIICLIYCPYIRRVAVRRKACDHMPDQALGQVEHWTPVSIIVYSQDEPEHLERFLPTVLDQYYPGTFEVIVVNEGDSGEVRNVVSALQLAHRNLYLTFTPEGVRGLSRKKLALTLGIKAARYDVVVLTTVDAVIESSQWLSKIMRHFRDDKTGIVLGYAAPGEGDRRNRPSRTCVFGYASESISWLSAAIGGHAFRGTELNLAYRRSLFFANKGFSQTLNLHAGDDDIFISEIATRDNTTVELSEESIVRFNSYDNSRTMRDIAVRHLQTNPYLKRRPKMRLVMGYLFMWIGLGSSIAALILDYSNLITLIAVPLLLIASIVTSMLTWRGATSALQLRRLTLTAPMLMLYYPFYRLYIKAYARLSKQKKFTWD